MTRRWSILLALITLLVACVPGAAPAVGAPTFRLVTPGSGALRFDLGSDGPTLTTRWRLEVTNPNPIALRLTDLAGALVLEEALAVDLRFVDGVDLPARGVAELVLDVAVPISDALVAVDVARDLVAGAPVAYRLDAAVGVDVFGIPSRFPRTTLVAGEFRGPALTALAPRLRWVPEASDVRPGAGGRWLVSLAFDVTNPSPLSYRVSAPDVSLRLDGRDVGRVGWPATLVPAGRTVRWVQEVVIDPVALGAVLAARLAGVAAGVGGVELTLVGALSLDLGPLGVVTTGPGDVGSGRLD
jgi:hypothetical protein